MEEEDERISSKLPVLILILRAGSLLVPDELVTGVPSSPS